MSYNNNTHQLALSNTTVADFLEDCDYVGCDATNLIADAMLSTLDGTTALLRDCMGLCEMMDTFVNSADGYIVSHISAMLYIVQKDAMKVSSMEDEYDAETMMLIHKASIEDLCYLRAEVSCLKTILEKYLFEYDAYLKSIYVLKKSIEAGTEDFVTDMDLLRNLELVRMQLYKFYKTRRVEFEGYFDVLTALKP